MPPCFIPEEFSNGLVPQLTLLRIKLKPSFGKWKRFPIPGLFKWHDVFCRLETTSLFHSILRQHIWLKRMQYQNYSPPFLLFGLSSYCINMTKSENFYIEQTLIDVINNRWWTSIEKFNSRTFFDYQNAFLHKFILYSYFYD